MTIEEIQASLRTIKSLSSDDELAHSMQDELCRDVLTSIALGADNARELAAEALKVHEIEFARWCA